jgi:hypothetical protein
MPLGDFAGRSAHHPTGQGASARSTPRQRLALAPPPGEPWAVVRTREQNEIRIAKWVAIAAALVVVGNFLVLMFADWLELVGVFVLMGAVAVAGYSPTWRKTYGDMVIENKKPVDPRRAHE